MGFFRKLWDSFHSAREDFAVERAVEGIKFQVQVIKDLRPPDQTLDSLLLDHYPIGYLGAFVNYFASGTKSSPLESHFLESKMYGEALGGALAQRLRERQQGLLFHQNQAKEPVLSRHRDELPKMLLLGARDGFEDAQRFGASKRWKPRKLADYFIRKLEG
jgi:hypothetical protein